MHTDRSDLPTARALCAWPTCAREPDVRVEYERDEKLDPSFVWLPAGAPGPAALCARHAAHLDDVLGPGRIVAVTRLQ